MMDMLPSGEIKEEFQMNMSLTEETSSVNEVQSLLKQQLGFEVILLDANTSSTNEVSLVSNTLHLELFSDFARWQHVHHTSDFFHITRPFLVVVRVGHFSQDLFMRLSVGKKRGTPRLGAVDCIAGTTELSSQSFVLG